jgi:outer membrane protein, heavy metal efflux system
MPTLHCAALSAAVLGLACVPADAGYQDVRQTTAERIHQEVRWSSHEASGAGDRQTRDLLARPLTADAAVQLALLNNPGLQAEFEELGVARARLVQALRLPNPTADASLKLEPSTSTNIEVHALLSISDLVFLPMRNGVARAGLDAAKASVAGRILDLALRTRVSFYNYQAAQQRLELQENIVVALGASFEAARNLHDAGNTTDLSFANERALYEESRVAHTRTEAELVLRREQLRPLLGLSGEESWAIEPRLPDAGPADDGLATLESRAIERSLDLEIIRNRFQASAKGANIAGIQGWLPELRAGVAAERDRGQWGIGPAVVVELPLFYQGQGERAAALADMRRQQQLYTDAAVRIRAAARSVAARLEAAAKAVDYYKRVLLPLREQIINDTQLQYNAMSVGVFQLLQAKRDQIDTARTYVDLLREYWVLRAEAEQLVAGRLPRGGESTDTGIDGDTASEPGLSAPSGCRAPTRMAPCNE